VKRLLVIPALLLACAGDDPPVAEVEDTVVRLTPSQHLVRASMALRGVRPTVDELDAVAADPSVLPAIVDYYLTTDEFGETIRDLHAESLLLGVAPDVFPAGFPAVGELEGRDAHAINVSVVEAPLRLVEHVVRNDRPYPEIVTADYTLADEVVATVWGLPYDDEEGGWQVTRYEDERPVAGILSDGFVFTRHSTTYSNKNRGRAANLARGLLCYDFLDRQVEIDSGIDLADEEAVANAIATNDACVSCHQTLDPLATLFADHFPIRVPAELESYPVRQFAPELRPLYAPRDAHPYFFGQPAVDLVDVGVHVANDPRFALCASRRFYGHLAGVEEGAIPLDVVDRYRDVFVESGQNARALARAIVLGDDFAVRRVTGDATDALVGVKRASPEQLARMFEDLTGYVWESDFDFDVGAGRVGRVDLMRDPFLGYSVLAGGTDSISVTRPARTWSATTALVLRGLAAHAAPHVVRSDLAEPDPSYRRLLTEVDPDTRDEPRIRGQLVMLHLRLFGERVTEEDPSVDAAYEVFADTLAARDDVSRAWTTTLFAMFQDIRVAYF